MISSLKEKIHRIYEEKYKLLLWIPIVMLFLAMLQVAVQVSTTGDFANRGITLKGGSAITLTSSPQFSVSSVDISALETKLHSQFPTADINVKTLSSFGERTGIVVESEFQDNENINQLVSAVMGVAPVGKDQYSVEIIGLALGESFFRETMVALLIAFLLMAIVVFAYFRMIVPSLSVILVAFSDIITTLAIFNLTGGKLGTGGVAAFLMLVGYSVDTEMLLNSKALKQPHNTFMKQIYSAIGTGMTMTLTVLAAVFVALIFGNNEVVQQIMLILFIGLLVDMINSWILNVGLLRWHMEKRGKKQHE